MAVMPKKKKKVNLWRHNKEALTKAGLWTFIVDSESRPWPDEQYLMPFIITMDDFANLRGMVNNTLAHFDNSQISSALRVPGQIDGKRLEDIDKLSIDEISNIFENGVDAKVGRRWSIETAKDPWKEWLSYVNK